MRIRTVGWVAALVALLVVLGLHLASRTLKAQIETALGKESQVGGISLGLFSVEISDLHVKAPSGWPAPETLSARRIVVVPDWVALLSRQVAIRSIRAEGVELSVLRDSAGHLRMLPSVMAAADKAPGTAAGKNVSGMPEVSIGEVMLHDAALDFYDATIAKQPYHVRLEQVEATLGHLHLPDLMGRSPLDLRGLLKGAQRDGTYALKGDIELATRDSELNVTMRNVDLRTLQPYLIRSANTGVKHGVLDLDLKSEVRKRQLDAHGALTLHDLALEDNGGFMGLPRQAAVDMLKNKGKDIRVQFALQGNLDDPKFSLNESLATRFGAGLADSLGVSISNLGRSVGNAASGIGGAIKGLFHK